MYSNFKKNLLFSILFLVFIVIFYSYNKNRRLKILDFPIYTTCTITELSKSARSEGYYKYKYTYKSISYIRGIGESSSDNLYVGKKYYIVLNKKKPQNAMLLPFVILPDSTRFPNNGWEEIPKELNINQIKKFLENY
ncbi:hypothetical protein SAMN05443634_1235 [Chishuiella changwenlii]|uniref:Uncharacterized protein n=1 Tax=Chishuiella changwenlii TaxID=1434701 RepID=A0A1M7DAV1_9FLAO|nr:hypothetical protein [Chishuiella changwenlii]GGF11685.1 hypothetical protein GCM10010984_30860 [Chishuiella changwenlii]SHL76537.1 hypothetical protein SAMN05443634_1235 [Chishuiella changwenlii]